MSPKGAALRLGQYFRDCHNGRVQAAERLPVPAVARACREVLGALDAAGVLPHDETVDEVSMGGLLGLMLRFWPGEYTYNYMMEPRTRAIDAATAILREFLAAALDIDGLLTGPLATEAKLAIEREDDREPAAESTSGAGRRGGADLRRATRSREQAIARMTLERELTDEAARLADVLADMEKRGVDNGPEGDIDDVRRARWLAAARAAGFDALELISSAAQERPLAAWGEQRQRETGLTGEQLRERQHIEAAAEAAARGPIPVRTINSRAELQSGVFDTPHWARDVEGLTVPKDCFELMRSGGMSVEGMETLQRDAIGNVVHNEWTQVRRQRGNIHKTQADSREERQQEIEAELEAEAREAVEMEIREHLMEQDEDSEYRKRGWGNRQNQG